MICLAWLQQGPSIIYKHYHFLVNRRQPITTMICLRTFSIILALSNSIIATVQRHKIPSGLNIISSCNENIQIRTEIDEKCLELFLNGTRMHFTVPCRFRNKDKLADLSHNSPRVWNGNVNICTDDAVIQGWNDVLTVLQTSLLVREVKIYPVNIISQLIRNIAYEWLALLSNDLPCNWVHPKCFQCIIRSVASMLAWL